MLNPLWVGYTPVSYTHLSQAQGMTQHTIYAEKTIHEAMHNICCLLYTSMFSRYNKEQMAELFASGKYSIFTKGRPEIYGVGNYFLNLTDEQGRVLLPLVFLDSNKMCIRDSYCGGITMVKIHT